MAADAYAPKWRHFHPSATVWVHNPFDHDVLFDVADEHGVAYNYRMPAGKTSELPGGAVATLGVKAIVDQLIQNSRDDQYSMWEVGVRTKYEEQIIVRIKESPTVATMAKGGEVNLGVSEEDIFEDEDSEMVKVETPFEELNVQASGGTVANPITDIAQASLGATNSVIEE